MEKDEVTPEGEQEEQNTEEEPEAPAEGEPKEDYQAKLNATNRFLEKEGYTFDEEKKRWVKTPKETSKEEPDNPPAQTGRLSEDDVIYIAKADIHEDDIGEVKEYAQKFGVSVKEAHRKMKPILEEYAKERKSAEATNTERSPRGDNKPKGEELLAKAQRGQLPDESDDKSIEALVAAEAAAKGKKLDV